MTHKDFMKESLCKFQFTPTKEGSYAIDTYFNFYFIHIMGKNGTSISLIKSKDLVNIAILNHCLPFITFESEILKKVITIIGEPLKYPEKLVNLNKILETYIDEY